MKSTSQKLILISFVFALIATILVFQYLQSLKVSKSSVKKATILVATETIPARTLIDKKMVKEMEVSDSSFFIDYISDTSSVIGKYTKETIFKNEGFLKDKLLSEGTSELPLKIDSDHRAIAINVSGDAGIAELIKPGDFVDVIVYLSEKKDGEKIIREDTSKIILQNINVLAIDKQLDRDNNTNTNDKDKIPTNFLVTLAVATNDCEKLVLAESTGTLKLALRSLNNERINETKGTTWQQLSSSPQVDNKESQGQDMSITSNNKEKYTSYTIKKGDTLKKISSAFYGDPKKYTVIKEANNITDENLIVTGTVIKIPIQG